MLRRLFKKSVKRASKINMYSTIMAGVILMLFFPKKVTVTVGSGGALDMSRKSFFKRELHIISCIICSYLRQNKIQTFFLISKLYVLLLCMWCCFYLHVFIDWYLLVVLILSINPHTPIPTKLLRDRDNTNVFWWQYRSVLTFLVD